MFSLYLARPLLMTELETEVNYIDLWVPFALLGLIVLAAVYFSRI